MERQVSPQNQYNSLLNKTSPISPMRSSVQSSHTNKNTSKLRERPSVKNKTLKTQTSMVGSGVHNTPRNRDASSSKR